MSEKLKAILIVTGSAAVIAGAGVLDYLHQERLKELREINTHLLYHGLQPEGSLSNARAVWQQHMEEHRIDQEFVDIINSNTWN